MLDLEDLNRRQIRYILFRLMTEKDGGAKATKEKAGPMQYVELVREHFEPQDDFGGWLKFAKTWDVDQKSPLVAVPRVSSIHTEWGKVVSQETKVLPAPSGKKFLTNKLGEKIQKNRLTFKGRPIQG